MPLTKQLAITAYFNCAKCVLERPPGITLENHAQLSVGLTDIGLQVWCNRHECNVLHLDFEGRKLPACSEA